MTLKEIQLKLYEDLKPSGWGDKLKMFLLSSDFANILQTLYTESTNDIKFTPVLKDLFSAFKNCPYKELKVIFVNNSPYSKIYFADGMAFSCSKAPVTSNILNLIFDDIERTVYHDTEKYNRNEDLTRWANQGVLLLNTALTTTIGKPDSHAELWKPFLEYLFEVLSMYNTGLVYVFFGEKTKHIRKYVGSSNYKFFIIHPSATHFNNKQHNWNSGDLFNNINKIMYDLYKEKILW